MLIVHWTFMHSFPPHVITLLVILGRGYNCPYSLLTLTYSHLLHSGDACLWATNRSPYCWILPGLSSCCSANVSVGQGGVGLIYCGRAGLVLLSGISVVFAGDVSWACPSSLMVVALGLELWPSFERGNYPYPHTHSSVIVSLCRSTRSWLHCSAVDCLAWSRGIVHGGDSFGAWPLLSLSHWSY